GGGVDARATARGLGATNLVRGRLEASQGVGQGGVGAARVLRLEGVSDREAVDDAAGVAAGRDERELLGVGHGTRSAKEGVRTGAGGGKRRRLWRSGSDARPMRTSGP